MYTEQNIVGLTDRDMEKWTDIGIDWAWGTLEDMLKPFVGVTFPAYAKTVREIAEGNSPIMRDWSQWEDIENENFHRPDDWLDVPEFTPPVVASPPPFPVPAPVSFAPVCHPGNMPIVAYPACPEACLGWLSFSRVTGFEIRSFPPLKDGNGNEPLTWVGFFCRMCLL